MTIPIAAGAESPLKPDEAPADKPRETVAGGGWLRSLRSRLGLPGAPTLRDTLETALEGKSDSAAFSS